MSRNCRKWPCYVLALIGAVAPTHLSAQSGGGCISGSIRDASGAVLYF